MPTNSSDDILRSILDNSILLATGERVLAIILARTLRGKFLPGSTSRGYSTKPAPMPFGALQERIGKGKASSVFASLKRENAELRKRKSSATGSFDSSATGDRIFRSKTGNMWVTLHGGYKRLRELSGRETDRVTLNWSGSMLRALKAKVNDAEPSLLIHFTDDQSARIAGYHHEGAGRSKIKRIFMGLAREEQREIEAWLGEELSKKLQSVGLQLIVSPK